jgi:hypothetical protein
MVVLERAAHIRQIGGLADWREPNRGAAATNPARSAPDIG